MTTVRAFLSEAEAGLAFSRLEAAGIKAFLADAISLAVVGAGTSAISIRLQVSDEYAERAWRVLKGQEGPEPLPDDFVPPAQLVSTADDVPKFAGRDLATAFVEGGLIALVTVGLPALSALANGGRTRVRWGDFVLLFIIGGLAGLAVFAYRKRQKDTQET